MSGSGARDRVAALRGSCRLGDVIHRLNEADVMTDFVEACWLAVFFALGLATKQNNNYPIFRAPRFRGAG